MNFRIIDLWIGSFYLQVSISIKTSSFSRPCRSDVGSNHSFEFDLSRTNLVDSWRLIADRSRAVSNHDVLGRPLSLIDAAVVHPEHIPICVVSHIRLYYDFHMTVNVLANLNATFPVKVTGTGAP